MLSKSFSLVVSLALLIVCLPIAVHAESPTDAGALLQQIDRERRQMQQERSVSSTQTESAAKKESAKNELKVTVSRFRFEGNTLLTDKELAAVVQGYLNHPVTYDELQDAAAAVGEVYRKRGWAVRSFLPKQDIVGGVVVIQMIEAKFGKILKEKESYRWPGQKKIAAMVAVQQKEGQALNTKKLERALLLIDDLPGVSASGRLQQGQKDGETDMVLKTEKEPLVSGVGILDNEGSRFTGEYRAQSFIQMMNLLHAGDQISAYLLYSEGLRYARFEQTLPAGDDGWRVGVNGSLSHYKILPSEFEALNANGDTASIGAQATYPIIRERQKSLYFDFNYDHKYFVNYAQEMTSSKYETDSCTTSLRGNMVDGFAGGGNTYANFSAIFGKLHTGSLNSGEDPALDGTYEKMTYNIARRQTVLSQLFFYTSLSGQFSPDKNLDSSEKFYLGGPEGVRAYPVSEGSGIEGQLLKAELRWIFRPQYQLSGFYDYGRIENYGGIKSYILQGAGLEFVWQLRSNMSVKLTWAHRIGKNPNPTSTGDDQDGSLRKDRFWVSMVLQF